MIGGDLILTSGAFRPRPSLAGTRLWASPLLSREAREALGAAAVSVDHVAANASLTRGGRADTLFVVLNGWTCRYVRARQDKQLISTLSVSGDVANLDALLFDRLDYDVRTITETMVAALPRDRALALAALHPCIAGTFTRLALIENATLSQRALSMAWRSARERVAHLLCELDVRIGGGADNTNAFAFPLRQDQIGDVTGLTGVHVNRTMQQLRRDNLVHTVDRVLTLPDVAALRRIARFDPYYLHDEVAATPQAA